jgi:hypothetical protein
MHEFETFVYLEMEKAASTFIANFLKKHAAERLLRARKHLGMDADCDRSKFYFTSVRDPLDAYISLYSFGCLNRGGFRTVLSRRGADAFYDGSLEGFSGWLYYVLDPANAAALGGGSGLAGAIAGLQSCRFLRLVIPDAKHVLLACAREDDIRRVYAEQRLTDDIVRYEHLAEDFARLLRGKLAHAFGDAEAVVQAMESERPRNASSRVDARRDDFILAPELVARLREREWFLYETFLY